jgi:hypothetical protein
MQFANLWVAMANHMGRINPTKDLKKVNNNTRLALSTEGQARCQANGGCEEVQAVLEMQNTAVNEFLCQEIFDANVFAHNLIAMWDVQKNREIAAAGAGTLPPAHKLELVGTSQAACGLDWTYKVSKESCSGGGTAAFVESGGQVVMEAEHFDSKRGAGSANFNQSGGAMVCGPDTGAFWTSGWGGNSPKLSFNVNFSSTGTYTVWVKAKAAHGGNDSFHAGLDGAENTSADKMTVGSQFGSFVWSKATMDGPAATLNVNSAGVHSVDIYAREDGIEIDKIVLTKSGSTPSGNGPAESPRSSGGGGASCSLSGSVVDFYSGFYRDYNPVLDIDVNGDTITGDPSGTTNDDPGSGSGSCTNACSKYNPTGNLIGSCCNCNGQEGHFIQTSMMGGKILACNF